MATMPLVVTRANIESAHIALAVQGASLGEECPIAQALKREGFAGVVVSLGEAGWDAPYRGRIELPEEAREFVRAFAEGRPVSPAVFVCRWLPPGPVWTVKDGQLVEQD